MKTLLLFACLLCCVFGCGNNGSNQNVISDEVKGAPFKRIVFKGGLMGIECLHTAYKYEVGEGMYKVQAMLKLTGKKRYKYLQLNARYIDANGKKMAQSIGGPGYVMGLGDSTLIETEWLFPNKDSLPWKVILTVSN